jgi:hypothetical protein
VFRGARAAEQFHDGLFIASESRQHSALGGIIPVLFEEQGQPASDRVNP